MTIKCAVRRATYSVNVVVMARLSTVSSDGIWLISSAAACAAESERIDVTDLASFDAIRNRMRLHNRVVPPLAE
jgi:hypothetical protein